MAFFVNGGSKYPVVKTTGGSVQALTTDAECSEVSLVRLKVEDKDRPRYHQRSGIVILHEAGRGWVRIVGNREKPDIVVVVELKPDIRVVVPPGVVYQLVAKPGIELHALMIFGPAWNKDDQKYLSSQDERTMNNSPAQRDHSYA